MDIILTHESKCPMGKFKGTSMKDIPAYYLLFIYEKKLAGKQMRRYIAENLAELKTK